VTTLLLHGRVHSPAMPDATAMAVRDGVVAWLGSDDIGRAQFPDAEIVDLDGAFVAPAFVDSHVHLTATGLTVAGLDLRNATSLRHCLALIADYVRAHPDGPIWAHGWDESGWPENTAPSTDDLDGVVRPAHPGPGHGDRRRRRMNAHLGDAQDVDERRVSRKAILLACGSGFSPTRSRARLSPCLQGHRALH